MTNLRKREMLCSREEKEEKVHIKITKPKTYMNLNHSIGQTVYITTLLCVCWSVKTILLRDDGIEDFTVYSNGDFKTDIEENILENSTDVKEQFKMCEIGKQICKRNIEELNENVKRDLLRLWMNHRPTIASMDRTLKDVETMPMSFDHVNHGGMHTPEDCIPDKKVAVLIPVRNRRLHLRLQLVRLHELLPRQKLEYTIYVVEQKYMYVVLRSLTTQTLNATAWSVWDADGTLTQYGMFNKALILNAAFIEIKERDYFDCFIFHDVDFMALSDRNLYICDDQMPRSMVSGYSRYKYRVPYPKYFGGVIAFTPEQYVDVNGFSNLYFGWGSEDDDLGKRVYSKYGNFCRYGTDFEQYYALKHIGSTRSAVRNKLRKTATHRMHVDGLSSTKYDLMSYSKKDLYTHLLIHVNETVYKKDIDYWVAESEKDWADEW